MAVMTYTTLTGAKNTAGSIKHWINFDLIEPDEILRDAEAYIYGAIRTREMRSIASIAVTLGGSTAALPTGFMEPGVLLHPDNERIRLTTIDNLARKRLRDGDDVLIRAPYFTWYAIADELLHFDVAAEAAITLTYTYYKRPAALSEANQTNFLTDRYPGLLRAACLMHAADYRSDDEKYARYKMRCDELMARASAEADLALRGAEYPVEIMDA